MKLLVAALAVALFGAAPFQCSSKQDPGLRIEDTPAQALWKLSQRFEAEGDSAACRATLSFLVERYPSALEAQQAKQVLAASSSAAGTSGGDHGSGTDADGASAPPWIATVVLLVGGVLGLRAVWPKIGEAWAAATEPTGGEA